MHIQHRHQLTEIALQHFGTICNRTQNDEFAISPFPGVLHFSLHRHCQHIFSQCCIDYLHTNLLSVILLNECGGGGHSWQLWL